MCHEPEEAAAAADQLCSGPGLFDDSGDLSPEAAEALAGEMGDQLPYVAEMALAVSHDGDLGGCDDDAEFEIGLDLILDGLERMRSA